jgi:hypothetical protein
MNGSLPKMSAGQRRFAVFALGLLVGLLGANSFADAAGFRTRQQELDIFARVVCGVVLGLAMMAFALAAVYFGSVIVAALQQSTRRPTKSWRSRWSFLVPFAYWQRLPLNGTWLLHRKLSAQPWQTDLADRRS